MKKILHVISSCDPATGGPIEGIKQFYNIYKKLNIEINILTNDGPKDKFLNDKNLPKVFTTGPLPIIYKKLNNFNPKLFNWLNHNIMNYDFVIVNGIWQFHNYAVFKTAKKFKIPYFVFPHGMLDPWFNENYFFKKIKKILYWNLIQHRVLQNAKKVLFTTKIESELAKKSFQPYKINSSVLGYGIEGNPFLKSKKNLFFKKFKKLKKKRILLYLGRITEKKGLDLLINAFNSIRETDTHLVIAGNSNNEYAKKLKSLINNLKINKFVTWTGPIYNKFKWDTFKAASLFCLSSHQENFGISVVEALSSGTPVLITNKINIYKIIKKYRCGYINNDDLKGTIKSLNEWKTNKDKNLYKKSIDCFNKNFQIENTVKKLIKILHEK
jgi:glycosyltransferase involved in cell wall biosynthesis